MFTDFGKVSRNIINVQSIGILIANFNTAIAAILSSFRSEICALNSTVILLLNDIVETIDRYVGKLLNVFRKANCGPFRGSVCKRAQFASTMIYKSMHECKCVCHLLHSCEDRWSGSELFGWTNEAVLCEDIQGYRTGKNIVTSKRSGA